MRIDGRLDPKPWVQPPTAESGVPARIVEQREQRESALVESVQHETDADFAGEMQHGYSYTQASRTAAAVAEMLETTPDL